MFCLIVSTSCRKPGKVAESFRDFFSDVPKIDDIPRIEALRGTSVIGVQEGSSEELSLEGEKVGYSLKSVREKPGSWGRSFCGVTSNGAAVRAEHQAKESFLPLIS